MNETGIPVSFISDHEGSFKRLSQDFEQIAKSKREQQKLGKDISLGIFTLKNLHVKEALLNG